MADISAQPHPGQREHIRKHLNPSMNVNDALEMTETDEDGAGGHEDDESQTHEDAVRDGGFADAVEEGHDGGREHHHHRSSGRGRTTAGSTTGASRHTSARGRTSTTARTSSVALGACDGG